MSTMTLVYNYPSGYFSGATPATKTVSRKSITGAPDNYNNYKVKSWKISWAGMTFVPGGIYTTFTISGITLTCDTSEQQSYYNYSFKETETISKKILDSASNNSCVIGVKRKSSGSGNACLFKGDITVEIEYEIVYSKCGAPILSVSGDGTPNAGTSVYLSWKGATAGLSNPIAGYEVYRATAIDGEYTKIYTTQNTSTTTISLSVQAPATMGASYYYYVLTVGTATGFNSDASNIVKITSKVITQCSAPTSFSANKTSIDKGESFTISWSGAGGGTNNAIKQYRLYESTNNKNWTSQYITAPTTSIKITPSPANDTTYYYKIATYGTAGEAYASPQTSTITIKVFTYTKCGDIVVSVSATVAESKITLSWTESTAGRNNPVNGYRIDYQDSNDNSTWETSKTLTTLNEQQRSYEVAVNPVSGRYRRFLITPIGTKAGYNGATTTSKSILTYHIPPKPIIVFPLGETANITYNSKPYISFFIAKEQDNQQMKIQVSIDNGNYQDLLTVPAEGGTYKARIPAAITVGEHTFTLRANDGYSNGEATEQQAIFYVVPAYSDDNPTIVKASHITEARTYINSIANYRKIPVFQWKEDIEANKTIVKAEHWTELQQALNALESSSFTQVRKNQQINKKVLSEIRKAITER